jgi:biopolymer transport protein TolR
MSMSSGRGTLAAEINVTPLVDVMLVLLVMFMITAPMMNTGVDLDLPESGGKVLEDPEGKLILSITSTQQIFLGASKVSWADLEAKLATNERIKKERELWIEADASLSYRVVVTAMAAARNAGILKLQMLTDPSEIMDFAELDNSAKSATPKGADKAQETP